MFSGKSLIHLVLLTIFLDVLANTYTVRISGLESCIELIANATTVSGINYSIEIKLSSLLGSVFH